MDRILSLLLGKDVKDAKVEDRLQQTEDKIVKLQDPIIKQGESSIEHREEAVIETVVVEDEFDHDNTKIEEHKLEEPEFGQDDSYEDSMRELVSLDDVETQYDEHPDWEYDSHVRGMIKTAKSKSKRNCLSEALGDVVGKKKLTKPKVNHEVVCQLKQLLSSQEQHNGQPVVALTESDSVMGRRVNPQEEVRQQELNQDVALTMVYADIPDPDVYDRVHGSLAAKSVIPAKKSFDVTTVISLKTSPNQLSDIPWHAGRMNQGVFTAEHCLAVPESFVEAAESTNSDQGILKFTFGHAGKLIQVQNITSVAALQGLLCWVKNYKYTEAERHHRHADRQVWHDLLPHLSRIVTYPSASSCDKPPSDPGEDLQVYTKQKRVDFELLEVCKFSKAGKQFWAQTLTSTADPLFGALDVGSLFDSGRNELQEFEEMFGLGYDLITGARCQDKIMVISLENLDKLQLYGPDLVKNLRAFGVICSEVSEWKNHMHKLRYLLNVWMKKINATLRIILAEFGVHFSSRGWNRITQSLKKFIAVQELCWYLHLLYLLLMLEKVDKEAKLDHLRYIWWLNELWIQEIIENKLGRLSCSMDSEDCNVLDVQVLSVYTWHPTLVNELLIRVSYARVCEEVAEMLRSHKFTLNIPPKVVLKDAEKSWRISSLLVVNKLIRLSLVGAIMLVGRCNNVLTSMSLHLTKKRAENCPFDLHRVCNAGLLDSAAAWVKLRGNQGFIKHIMSWVSRWLCELNKLDIFAAEHLNPARNQVPEANMHLRHADQQVRNEIILFWSCSNCV